MVVNGMGKVDYIEVFSSRLVSANRQRPSSPACFRVGNHFKSVVFLVQHVQHCFGHSKHILPFCHGFEHSYVH